MKEFAFRTSSILLIFGILMVITNVVGYDGHLWESVLGVFVLCAIAFVGYLISFFMERFVKLPRMMYIALLALLLACPISPIAGWITDVTAKANFMAAGTALGAFAGINLGRDLKNFLKAGWKYIIITVFVIIGTFIGSAAIAHVVLVLTGAI